MPTEKVHFAGARQLSQLFANDERNLAEAEQALGARIVARDDWIEIDGEEPAVEAVKQLFESLEKARDQGLRIRGSDFLYMLRAVADGRVEELREIYENPYTIRLKRGSIVPKTLNQKRYLQSIDGNPVTFGIGPAGTGKTYLAVAMALQALLEGTVDRIVVTRPAVEAGEALGFLPGELQEKVLPYLTPLYDAMHDMIGKERTLQLIERGAIEIAPLAYMRGRTLANAFAVLDEAQNTTHEQMVMFLTRLGENSRMVVTGDITQIDLPRSKHSGLKEAARVLGHLDGIRVFEFASQDVVRHPIVQRIVDAYAADERRRENAGE